MITLAEDLDIDSVTSIFIRINSRGVSLSQADFAMSKIASNEIYGGNITRKMIDYFCHLLKSPEDLKDIEKNDTSFIKLPEFAAIKWAANKIMSVYEVLYKDILRVTFTYKFKRGKLADLVSLLSGRDFKTREFREEIAKESFEKLHEAVLQTINETNYNRYLMILESAGIIRASLVGSQSSLNFGYVLYLALREKKISADEIEKIVRRWVILSILTGRYSGSSESAFDYDIKKFFSYDNPREYLKLVEDGNLSNAFWDVNIIQHLDTSVAKSPYFKIFLIAQVKAHDKGFLSEQIEVENMLANRGDRHHLFPEKYLMQYGLSKTRYNQIANYVYVQQEINVKISDMAPRTYMHSVLQQCQTKKTMYGGITDENKLKKNLAENCIPFDFIDMDVNDYDEFLLKRRELMAKKIKQYYENL